MVINVKEEEEAVGEDNLAKGFDGKAPKSPEELEREADDIINQAYHPEKYEADQKTRKAEEETKATKQKEEEKEEQKEEQKEEEEYPGKKEKPAEEKKEVEAVIDEEITTDETDTIQTLKEKIARSEQRVKENRKAQSNAKKELREERIASKAIVETFNQTIKDLQNSISHKAEASTKWGERVAEKEIKESIVDLKQQFETLNNIDPDIAAPIKEIIESLTGQIGKLQTELKTKTETDNKTAQMSANEAHFKKIDDAHPDNEEITGSDEFEEYIEGLSPRNKRLARQDLESGTAENIIELLDDYKKATGIALKTENPKDTNAPVRDNKVEKAKTMVGPNLNKSKEVKTSKNVKYTRAMLKEHHGDAQWFAEHEAEIDREMAAGNIPDN